MLKRLVAVLSVALLATGAAVVATVPATASAPTVTTTCDGLVVAAAGFAEDSVNTLTVTVDGVAIATQTFGAAIGPVTFPLAASSSHRYVVEIDAQDDTLDRTGAAGSAFTGEWVPCASTDLTCDAATLGTGATLVPGDAILMDVDYQGTRSRASATVDSASGGDPATDSGLVLRVELPGGATVLPLSRDAVNAGTLRFAYSTGWNGPWTVEWVDFGRSTFNGDRDPARFVNCERDIPIVITSEPAASAPTCSADGALRLPALDHVTWSGGSNGDGPGAYTITATVDDGYTLNGAQSTWVVQVLPKGTGLDCGPPPCIPASAISYTYDAATNFGTLTVPDLPGSSGELCDGFWVTSAAWKYAGAGIWPQNLDQAIPMPEFDGSFFVDEPGVFQFGAEVRCGQGDIYASYEAQPTPTPQLLGPGNPFRETFLHEMGFDGPTPTYRGDMPGCNRVTPVAPAVTPITECGTDGAVVPVATEGVVYTLTAGDGRSGPYTVTATPATNYYFEGSQVVEFSGDLGARTECVKAVEPELTPGVCPAGSTFATPAFVTIPSIANLVYRVDGVVVAAGSKVDLAPGTHVVTVQALPGYTNTGPSSFTIVVRAVPGCDNGVTYVAPKVTDEVCDVDSGEVFESFLTFTASSGISFELDGDPVVFPIGASTVKVAADPGRHVVTVIAGPGLFLAGTDGKKTIDLEIVIAEADECGRGVEYVAPRVTAETCDARLGGTLNGVVRFTLVDNLTYVFDGVPVTAANLVFERPAGTYTLLVTAADGFYIIGGDATESYQITVPPPATTCDTVIRIPIDPFASPEECVPDSPTGEKTDGSITIVYVANVSWFVADNLDGIRQPVTVTPAGNVPGSPGLTALPFPAGNYTVWAVADAGFQIALPGAANPVDEASFAVRILPPSLDCDLPTDAELPTGASWTNQVCTPGGLRAPTITVVPFPGVTYFIDGKKVVTRTTVVSVGPHLIEATADDPRNTVTTSSWSPTLKAAPTAVCNDLTTLAFTGETPGGWLAAAGVLLQAGLTMFALQFAMRRRRVTPAVA